jgi:hypothetical protein
MNSQRTFLIGMEKEDQKRWSWIFTSIFKGCLRKKIEKYISFDHLIELYIPEFFEKINRLVTNVNSKIIFLCFESVCANRRCLKNILHRDMTISYPNNRFVFLGMNVLDDHHKYYFIPHYSSINQGIFEQPMTWIDNQMTGEKIQKILSLYKKYYEKDIKKFIQLTNPSIINYEKDLEGFILYGEDTILKIKDDTFCHAFLQKQKNKISHRFIQYFPFYKKCLQFDKDYSAIIQNIHNPDRSSFQKAFQEKGYQLEFLGPINKNFSFGILDYLQIIDPSEKNILYNDEKILKRYIDEFIIKYWDSIIIDTQHWRHCFFSCCDL